MGGENSKHANTMSGPQKTAKMKEYMNSLEKVDIPITGAASEHDPTKLRKALSVSGMDETDAAALTINPNDLKFPFENIVLEGGGNKGLAYVGVIKCFENLGMLKQIKRIGGTSAGAITAALFAIGYSAEDILTFLSDDIESIFLDHSCGYFSLLPNLFRNYGWNPGNKVYEWFGNAINKKTGDPDYTFHDLYKQNGTELCIVVTNLNLMTAQYCHVKTTPNMPIRDALRMTMAIPAVFSAVPYDNHGQEDVFVDGGVLMNYPVNCFDGWYLSMENEDSFLSKLRSLDDLPILMSNSNRFKPKGPNKTIGFLLFNDSEREIMRFELENRIGTLLPEKPAEDTKLYLENEEKKRNSEKAEKAHNRIVRAVDSFLNIIQKHNIKDQRYITIDELKAAFEDKDFPKEDRDILFGADATLDKAFEILDKDGNDRIAFFELLQFIEERGIRMQLRFQGYGRRKVDSLGSFLTALQETLLTNLKYTAVTGHDIDRTCGINTGHVGTMNYVLETADRDFVVQRGYNATMSFLRYYAANHPTEVTQKQEEVQDQQPTSIHQ